MSDLTKEQLEAEFDNIDSEGNGSLSLEELTLFIAVAFPKMSDLNIQQIFKFIDADDTGRVTFDQFYGWSQIKGDNFLSILQSILKYFEKAKQVIDESKSKDSSQKDNLKHFKVSLKTGDSPSKCKSEIGFKLSTGIKSVEFSKPIHEALGLEDNQPCFVLKYKVSKSQLIAQQKLTELIQQTREFLESILPSEINELILEKIQTIAEPLGSEYLLLGFFSDHPLINLIFQSFSLLLNSFNFGDQSAVLDFSVQSNLDLKEAFDDPDNLIKHLANGLNLNLDIQASRIVLNNLRKVYFDKVLNEYEEGENLSSKSKVQRFFAIIGSLINGISISAQTKDLSQFLQSFFTVPFKLSSLLFPEITNLMNSKNSIFNLPLMSDLHDFSVENLESQIEGFLITPGIYTEFKLSLKNIYLIYKNLFMN